MKERRKKSYEEQDKIKYNGRRIKYIKKNMYGPLWKWYV